MTIQPIKQRLSTIDNIHPSFLLAKEWYVRILILLLILISNLSLGAQTYCTSNGAITYNDEITLVSFNTIDNVTSVKSAYNDFTSISTALVRDSTYDLTVKVNTDGNYTYSTKAWIDWNDNGDFEDSGEEYDLGDVTYVSNGVAGGLPLSILVPSSASLGSTRMRVSTRWNTFPSACGTSFDGEVEDYTLEILAVPVDPCTDASGIDTDGDGINNYCDLDDDNDGILDSDEYDCVSSTLAWENYYDEKDGYKTNFTVGQDPTEDPVITIDGVTLSIGRTTTDGLGGNWRINNYYTDDLYAYTWLQESELNGQSVHTFTFSRAVSNLSFTMYDVDVASNFQDKLVISVFSEGIPYTLTSSDYTLGANIFYSADNTFLGGGTDQNLMLHITVPVSSMEISYNQVGANPSYYQGAAIGALSFCVPEDTDADGIPDYLDTDSDDDGCPDAIEGSGSFLSSNLTNDRLTGADGDDDGVIDGITTQGVGTSKDFSVQGAGCVDPCDAVASGNSDLDGDGISDICDADYNSDFVYILGTVFLDADLDTILDNVEQGLAGVDVLLYKDVNGDNLVDAGDTYIDTYTTDVDGNYLFDMLLSSGSTKTVSSRVSDDADDAEEEVSNDDMHLTSSDLELVTDGSDVQIVGMRFQSIDIPPGAIITSAYIEFETDETDTETTNLTFSGQAIGDAPTFTNIDGDMSNRTKTSSTVSWNNVPEWNIISEKHQTPDLSSIIQEIVNRSDWTNSNSLVMLVEGSGSRVAKSNDFNSSNSGPLLVIEYSPYYMMAIDPSTLPVNAGMTTDNLETALFSATILSDNDNDFGIASADLSITKDDGVTEIAAGDGMTYIYTLLLTNNGPTDAINVEVTDTWPVDFSPITRTSSNGTIVVVEPNFTWTFPAFSVGQSDSVKVSYTVPVTTVPGDYTNELAVTSDFDPITTNNTATDVNTIINSVDPCDPIASGNTDTDGDGMSDVCDLDDDNDGILDSDESGGSTVLTISPSGLNEISSTVNSTGVNYVTVTASGNTGSGNGSEVFPSSFNIKGTLGADNILDSSEIVFTSEKFDDGFSFSVNGTKVLYFDQYHWDPNEGTSTSDEFVTNGKFDVDGSGLWTPWSNEGHPQLIIKNGSIRLMVDTKYNDVNGNPIREDALPYMDPTETTNEAFLLDESFSYDLFASGGANFEVSNTNHYGPSEMTGLLISAKVYVSMDTDDDGIPDYHDADSDNDGCPDATEAADHLATVVDTLAGGSNGGSSENLGIEINANGIPTAATTSGTTAGTETTGQATTPDVTIATKIEVDATLLVDQSVAEGASTSFTITSATAFSTTTFVAGIPVYSTPDVSDPLVYQWQESTGGGASFSDLSDGSVYSGTNTIQLNISNVSGLTGHVYNLIVTHSENHCVDLQYSATLSTFDPCSLGADTDGDGVNDICDLDDDNDGILDVDENSCGITNSTLLFEDFGVATYSGSIESTSFPVYDPTVTTHFTYRLVTDPYSNSINDNYYSIFHSIPESATWAASAWQTVGDHTVGSATPTLDRMLMVNAGNTLGVIYQKTLTGITAGAHIAVSFWGLNLIYDGTRAKPNVKVEVKQNGILLGNDSTGEFPAGPLGDPSAWNEYSFGPFIAGDNSDITIVFTNIVSETNANDLALDDILVTQYCDTDGDGLPDYHDTDSDNDGCPDATEGAGHRATSATLAGGSNGGSSENLGIAVDANGIPDDVSAAGGQANASAVVDSCDNICNPFELTISNQTIDCGGCTGSYSYSISGGVAPYTIVGPTVGVIASEMEQIITFDGQSALSDYPVAFNIVHETEMQSDFSDIYFTDASGNNLSFWIEDRVLNASAKVWVKISTMAAVRDSIRMFYGSGLNISGSDIDRVMSYGGLNMEVYFSSYASPQTRYDTRASKGVCTDFGSIDHDWGGDTIYTCVYSAANNISLGWTGWLVLPEEATSTQYTFISEVDDGLFLRLDGDSVYPFDDTWDLHNNATYTATYSTTKEAVSLSFEMFENQGNASATFEWDYSGNSAGTTIVPGSAFRYLPYVDPALLPTNISREASKAATINKRSYLCSGVDTLTVIDSKGCSIESYVDILPDIISPVAVFCPSDISVCSTLYDPIDPEFSDNCSIAQVNWEMTGATVATGSGYVGLYDFTEGITTLTYTAQDFSGNSVTCVSEITIDLPHFLGSSVNGPICAGDDAVFTLNGTAGNIVTFSGDTSGIITIDAGGSVDLVVMGATSNVVIDFTQISNASCDLPLSVSDTVIVYNSRPLAYDGFSDNAYGWADGLDSSDWSEGDNPTMYDISDSRASMVYEYADSGIYVDGGSDYLYTNTATNGNPDVNQSKFVSRTPLDSMDETFYISFLARFSDVPSGTWKYLAVGKKDNVDDAGVGLGHLNDSKLGFSFADNGPLNSTIGSSSPTAMTTYFVVGKWTVNENGISKIDIFLNPTSLSLERSEFHSSVTLPSEDTDMNSIDIQSYFADTTYFDEIRYGYSWESVVPHHILVSSDDDNIINSGEAVTFTAYGGGEYEFFLNGTSVQGPNTTATYTNSTLANADLVKVIVHHQNGCDTDTAEITTYLAVRDYGDAPISYDADSAASHILPTVPLIYLGSVAPDEEATATSGDGTGDDVNGSDDEDAFSFFPPLTTMRLNYTLHVPITNTSGDSVTVAAWIDVNGDGTFDTSERADTTIAFGEDTATLVWSSTSFISMMANDLSTYIRVRIASDKSELVSANSRASDGEVEDYSFEILYAGACPTEAFLVQDADSKWYDVDLATASYVPANDNYAGKLNGVGFNVLDGLIYGYDTGNQDGSISITSVNSTTSPTTYTTYLVGPIPGLPTGKGFYVGDVGAGNLYLRQGNQPVMYVINVDPESPGYLSEAIARPISGVTGSYTDMVYLPSNDTIYCINNTNGDLHSIDPVSGTTAIVDTSCVPIGTYGAQYLDVNGFMYASDNVGPIYRLSLTGNPNYQGVLWANGPISSSNDGARCPNAPVPIDFGDAPASYITEISYGTQIGARHAVPLYDESTHTAPLMLGSLIDIEINGQPSSGADGDDIDGFDDEDGVALLTSLNTSSTTYSTTVSVLNNTSHTVYLSGYIDFDGDSLFSADERTDVTISSSLPTNQNIELIWTGIGSTIDINPGSTYMRLRLSSQDTAVQVANGIAIDGEVEDYALFINGIVTDSVTQIEETTAMLYGHLQKGSSIVEYGFYYSTDNNTASLGGASPFVVRAYDDVAVDFDSLSYSKVVSALTNRSGYYFRAYMKDASDNYTYGKVVRFLSEKRDFSLALDGDGDFLLIDSTTTHDVINDWGVNDNTFSVDFWMRNASMNTTKMALVSDTCKSGLNSMGYMIAFNQGKFYFESGGYMNKTDPVIFDQEWHHVACTYNDRTARIYIDDSLIPSSYPGILLRRPTVDVSCRIGSTNPSNELDKFCYFNGNIDAMRFWNVELTAEQISELCYDNVKSNPSSNTITCIASGRVIPGLTADNLTASLGFNVMSTQESVATVPVDIHYPSQDSLHALPFFHNDARLTQDKVAFNIVAVGDAHPSPYLPRVYWRYNSIENAWLNSDNWGGYAFPGEGASQSDFPDVATIATGDLPNDSAYCLYTVVDSSANSPLVTVTPPEVQVLIDRHDSIGTYRVDETSSELTILKGIYPEIFDVVVDNEEGSIVIEEGSMEVFHY